MSPAQITKAAQSAYTRTLAAFTQRWGEPRARERATQDASDVASYLAREAEIPGAFDSERIEWKTAVVHPAWFKGKS